MFPKTFVYKTPFLCNAECKFCLSKATKVSKSYVYPKHRIVWEFLKIKKMWFESVILVWWESTIIENLKDYVIVSKKLWLDLIITTNWIVFSDFKYLEYLYKLWLRNIIFSVHSHIWVIHDELVWIQWAFDYMVKAIDNANKLNFQHISTSTVICKQNQDSLTDAIKYFRDNFNIFINNFCNLEVSYKNKQDYKKKSHLFPDLKIIQTEIQKIHQTFEKSIWTIWLQNLPLCAFNNDTFYLTHEYSWKERYYENDFESEFSMNQRIKDKKCMDCTLNSQCKWFFPYFNTSDIITFYE